MDSREAHLPTGFFLGSALVLAPFAFGATESWSRSVLTALIVCFALVRASAFGLRNSLPRRWPPLLWGIAGLLVLAACQAANPVSPLGIALARAPFTCSKAATLDWIIRWTAYGTILAFSPDVFRSKEARHRLAWLLLICGAGLAVVGIAQQEAGNAAYYGIRRVSEFRVPFGPFPNKNHAASYLVTCSLAGAALFLSALERRPRRDEAPASDEHYGRLAVILVLVTLVILGLLRTGSRGALPALALAAAFAGVVWAWSRKGGARAAIIGVALVPPLAAMFLIRPSNGRSVDFVPSSRENSVVFRKAMVKDGLRMIADFPVFGIGLGATDAAYPLWKSPDLGPFDTDHLHCDPLELAAEAGVPLGVVYYGAFLATVLLCVAAARRTSDPVSLGLASTAIAALVHQLWEFPSHIMSLQLTVMLCLGAAWGAREPEIERGSAPGSDPRPVHPVAWTAAALAAVLIVARPVAAAYFDLLASRYPQPSRLYFQSQALRAEPTFERQLKLARSYSDISRETPAAATALLRSAASHSQAALELKPLDTEARALHSRILAGLRRAPDAHAP